MLYSIYVIERDNNMIDTPLTQKSVNLLIKIAKNAEYENDDNNFFDALMKFTAEERGNLADLKKKGFVETIADEGGYIWVIFTEMSIPLAKAIR